MLVCQLDKSPRAGWLGQSINIFIIWRINSQIQYLEGVLKSCYSSQFKKEMVSVRSLQLTGFGLLGLLVCFFWRASKKNILELNLRNTRNVMADFFVFFLAFIPITLSLHASLLKASLIRWLWTSTATEPGCESELHASVSLGNRLKLSVTCILYSRLWIITILSHWILMRLSNLKYVKSLRTILDTKWIQFKHWLALEVTSSVWWKDGDTIITLLCLYIFSFHLDERVHKNKWKLII